MAVSIEDIDNLLPQNQCGLCNYAGCRRYAKAIIKDNEKINRCLPGGVNTLRELGKALGQNPAPYFSEMKTKEKPDAIAIIRETECIGCTKCIQACPTDAIIGASQKMHTVISDACTGCELCIPSCPVDCIDIKILPRPNSKIKKIQSEKWRSRYKKRNQRLEKAKKRAVKTAGSLKERHAFIKAALSRVENKKRLSGTDIVKPDQDI